MKVSGKGVRARDFVKMTCDIFLTLSENSKMPALGYGTYRSTDDSLEKALEVALETGYRHIDTAQAYQNEDKIGKILKTWFDSGKLQRKDIFVTTKLSPWSLYPEKVEECLKESLKKLQLDYVDLYLAHFPIAIVREGNLNYGHPNNDYVAVWKKMEEQYDAGRAKSIGISNFSIKKIRKILENCRIKPANHQIEMHIYFQQKELVDFCNQNGITVVAYAPLGAGSYSAFRKSVGIPIKELPAPLSDETVVAIAKKHSKKPSQILLRFLLQLGVAPIPKSLTPERIKENFDVFDFVLDEEDISKLRALDVGPDARIYDFGMFGKANEHPDFEF